MQRVEETAVAEYERVELLLALDVGLSGAALDASEEGNLALSELAPGLPHSEGRTLTGLASAVRAGLRWPVARRSCHFSASPCHYVTTVISVFWESSGRFSNLPG